MTNTDIINQFINVIESLKGKPCWSVQVSGVGSLANLHFGAKIPREQALTHPDFKIGVEERMNQGEIVLYLEECPWRVDSPSAVLCSWMDENRTGGRLVEGLMQLKGLDVVDVQVIQPAFDLIITFAGGLVLRVFPDQANADEGDNYAVNLSDGTTFILSAHSTLYIE
jgi:hypothetical protein